MTGQEVLTKYSIRDRLRHWEQQNPNRSETILSDYAGYGELSNNITRPQNVSMASFETASPLFDGDELGDLRADDANLKPGDMVELRYVDSLTRFFSLQMKSYTPAVLMHRDGQ